MLTDAKIELNVTGNFAAASPNALAPARAPLNYRYSSDLANGTAANQANRGFVMSGSVTGNPVEVDTYDLSGALTDPVGDPAVFAEGVTIVVVHKGTTGTLNLYGSLVDAVFHVGEESIPIGPGGLFVFHVPAATAWPVTNTSADQLALSSSSGTISYDLIIIGRSA